MNIKLTDNQFILKKLALEGFLAQVIEYAPFSRAPILRFAEKHF
jgi:hypothetical protein